VVVGFTVPCTTPGTGFNTGVVAVTGVAVATIVGAPTCTGVTLDGRFAVAPVDPTEVPVGVTAAAIGVTAFEYAGALCTPCVLVAVTWNMYVLPLASPGTVIDVAPVLTVGPFGRACTV
jgi:hypothetical protein